ncbi:hypothetical protein [Undibacterium curvum]|uniref:Uncharacterized protein n=1 Tax=Undibacterium curvum TaxID=2762294 RepID=A0ABR7A5L6_9BURK|nr:hypothetical protein [Undibacterium curvum]MBC3932191.1 hypothetical protein [Undibacterium curvum]
MVGDASATALWGEMCVCCHCGEIHLAAHPYGPPAENFIYFLRKVKPKGKRLASFYWLKTNQYCDDKHWLVTSLPKELDLSQTHCTRCGQGPLQSALYAGIECPQCRQGKIEHFFNGH